MLEIPYICEWLGKVYAHYEADKPEWLLELR